MYLKNKGRLGAVALVLGLAVMLGLFAAGADQAKAQPTPNITIAYPAGTPVGLGSNFDVEVSVATGAATINTYQVEVDVPANLTYVTGTHAVTPFTTCFAWAAGPIAGPTWQNTACSKGPPDVTFTGLVETVTLACGNVAGIYPVNLVDFNEDALNGSYFYDSAGPVMANTTPDGTVLVQCVASSNIVVTKSEDTDPVAAGVPFNYKVKATNMGPQAAVNLTVADVLPDLADGDGRGHKVLLGVPTLGVDITGDTNVDIPMACIPGFIGPYTNPFPPPVTFNSTIVCATLFLPPPANPLAMGASVVVGIPIMAPLAEAGGYNFNIGQGPLSCTPPFGNAACTVDPDPTNEADCVTLQGPLPPANAGCELTIVMPAAVSIGKSGAPDPAKDGDNITWTVDIDVGAGSAASDPYGEGGSPNSVANCFDNLDNDADQLVDFDGDPAGQATAPDPDCANQGPVITDNVEDATASAIVSATMDVNGDTTPDAGACREAGGVPAINLAGEPDVICSLTAPLPAGTTNAKLVVVTTAETSGVTDCDDTATITYANAAAPKALSASDGVVCQPAGVTQHLDKGAVVIPTPINVLVGHTARVIVAETIEIIDPGPSPNLVHEWKGTSAAADGIQIDWVEQTGDTDLPVGFTDTVDLLTFLTTGHTQGLITLSRTLDVRCDAAGNQTNVDISLKSIGATTQISPTTLKVQCFNTPQEVKSPDSANLWLMRHMNCVDDDADSKVDEDPVDFDESGVPIDNDGDGVANEDFGPCNPYEGKGSILIEEVGSAIADFDSPNDADNDPEGLGAYEKQIKFDHKLLHLKVEDAGFLGSTGRSVNCTLGIVTENWILFGCVSIGSQNGPTDPGPVTLTRIWVTPEADLFTRIRPTKDNGVVTTVLDENCEWADKFGEPMAGMVDGGLVPVCDDATLTIRMLEGDVNLDCNVDVLDEQGIAFRYGSSFGLLLYSQFYDLEPKVTDFDIDIKDLQFVFGRDGSTCNVPIPLQEPVP